MPAPDISGRDTLNGEGNDDSLDGGEDDDLLSGGWDDDDLRGGAGIDTATYAASSGGVVVSVDGAANDGESGEADNVRTDVENVIGGNGNDRITGSALANVLSGGAGDDVLFGEGGNDTVNGEAGEDSLYGGAGDDRLAGGDNRDTLVALGGGVNDQVIGGWGYDSMWLDDAASEFCDAEAGELYNRFIHRIGSFANGASTELNGTYVWTPNPEAVNDDTESYPLVNPLGGGALFGPGGPSRNDVNQGGLGDCWFLATLSAIAGQDPDIIRNSIVDLGDQTYAVMFFEGSAPVFYRVSAAVPVLGNGMVAYAQVPAGGSIWAPIMEKAYAFHEGGGDYAGIESDSAVTAFDDFDIHNEQIDVDDDDVLQRIADLLAAGHAVTIDSTYGDDFEIGDNFALNHVYTVVSVDVAAGTILLRNPWATDGQGGFVQGKDDGYVNYVWDTMTDDTDDFTVGYI